MAVYKVPQDVEAEDKLIGPFGFRQFIYLLIAAGAGGLTYLFVRAPLPIPAFSVFTVPVALALVILALPLKKDQPMEVYIAAVLRFWFKPKRRVWRNGGLASGSTVIIDAPPVVQRQLAKDISEEQAMDKLTHLSQIVDTHGWAAKGVDVPPEEDYAYITPQNANPYLNAEDMMDENTDVSKSFDNLLSQQKEQSRQKLMEQMKNSVQQQSQAQTPEQNQQPKQGARPADRWEKMVADAETSTHNEKAPRYDPYPKMHQQVLSPLDKLRKPTFGSSEETDQKAKSAPEQSQPQKPAENTQPQEDETTSNKNMTQQMSPDIMNLANNNDLSIQAIANEAHRAQQKNDDEVVVNLH